MPTDALTRTERDAAAFDEPVDDEYAARFGHRGQSVPAAADRSVPDEADA